MYAEKGWTFAQFHGENEFFFSTVVAWALMESGSILPVTQDGPTLQEQHDEDAWLFHESERPTDDALRAEAVRVKAARNRRRAEYEERTKKKAATS
jgi:hypothetical protein